jgi:tRNA A37 threonylcarbamoyladenosine modification protein TsaB
MNLFLQAITDPGILILFDDTRFIIAKQNFSLLWKESSSLLREIEQFLAKQDLQTLDLNHIIVVNGPGSFTGIRSIVLIVNTLSFIFPHLKLTPLSYFDLFSWFPVVKQSSKRDIFVQFSQAEIIEIIGNTTFLEKLKERGVLKIFWDAKIDLGDIFLENIPDYDTLCKTIVLQQKKRIEPLYIKKPNIS